MSIQHAIWQVADQPFTLPNTKLARGQLLEFMTVRELCNFVRNCMSIEKQEVASHDGRIEQQAIEHKDYLSLLAGLHDCTSRDLVVQARLANVLVATDERLLQLCKSPI